VPEAVGFVHLPEPDHPGPTLRENEMLSFPKTAAARQRAAASAGPGNRTSAGPPWPTTRMTGGQAPATAAGGASIPTPASPAAVFITERQVALATAAAGTAAHTAVTRHPRLSLTWLRLSPRPHAQREPRGYRPSGSRLYLENAAMAREMGRL
jgi:hypothetical protein